MDCKIDLSAFVIDRDEMEKVQLDMKSRTYLDAVERVAAINEKSAEQVVIVAQQARIAELEKALEPFAREAADWSQLGEDSDVPLICGPDNPEELSDAVFSIGDLRRAAALLKDK